MAPGYIFSPPGSPHLHKNTPPFSFTTTPKCTSRTETWQELHSSRVQSPPVTATHHGEDVSTTNNTTVMSPSHPYQETFSRSRKRKQNSAGARRLLAPVWLTDNICRILCSALSDVVCWRNLQITHVTVPGPRLVGVAREGLL